MSRLGVRFAVVLSTLSIIFGTMGCGAGGVANLRVLNAAVDSQQVNVLVDGTTVNSNLAYSANTGYLSVNAGSRHLQVESVTSTTPILDTTVTLGSTTNTTVIAAGVTTPLSPIVLTDEITAPSSGTSLLRPVIAAPSLGSADVFAVPCGTSISGTAPLVAGVTYGTAPTTYQNLTITAGTSVDYCIYFTDPGTFLARLATQPISIASGEALTVVAIEDLNGGLTFEALVDLQ